MKDLENNNMDLKEKFKPIATTYRFYTKISTLIESFYLFSFFGFLFFCYREGKLNIEHPSTSVAISILAFALIVGLLSLFAHYKRTRIKCPGCKNCVSNRYSLGAYCPNFGENWSDYPFKDWHCSACEQTIKKGLVTVTFRSFGGFESINFHYCTHCGSHLSDELL